MVLEKVARSEKLGGFFVCHYSKKNSLKQDFWSADRLDDKCSRDI